ncbi:MAG: DUF4870 domain-containing protein [Nitrospirota bacterium]|nr:MAG: DUF4870 domain-containing protein [Nitrospirota bacterium]
MLRRSVFSDIALSVVAFIVLSFIGWLIAPLIVVVVLIKRVNAERTAKGTLSTSEAPHEASSTSPSPSNDERTWATFCHLGALAIYFFPLAHLIVPLVLWLIKKDQYPFVDDQGKESLNFQISMTIYYIVSAVLMLVVIGCVLLVALGIFNLIVVIIASVKANRGERYRYPLCIRFIR